MCRAFGVHIFWPTLYSVNFPFIRWPTSDNVPPIGVGDGGTCPQNYGKIFLSGNYHVKFGHFSGKWRVKLRYFVNFSYIYFRAKMCCPSKFTELIRLQIWCSCGVVVVYTVGVVRAGLEGRCHLWRLL